MITYQVVIVYNKPRGLQNRWDESDTGVLNEVDQISKALEALHIKYTKFAISSLKEFENIQDIISSNTIIFNLVEDLPEDYRNAFNKIPDICKKLRIPCTGNSTETLELTFDKYLTKKKLIEAGINTPKALLVEQSSNMSTILPSFPPPWIVKPRYADGSEGIDSEICFVENPAKLELATKTVMASFGDVLIEEYIEGREVNQAIWEFKREIKLLPLSEIDFSLFPRDKKHIVDYKVKWIAGTIPGHISPRKIPASIDEDLLQKTQKVALESFIVCKASDYARVDMRINSKNEVYVLEVNANPDISPNAGFTAALAAAKVEFTEFVEKLLLNAIERQKNQ